MGNDTTTFTYNSTTGASDLYGWTDTASNTGTGIMVHPHTASGSTEIPFCADSNGVGWCIEPDGSLHGIGTATSHGMILPASSSGGLSPVASSGGITTDASGNTLSSDAGGAFARVCNATNGLCSGTTGVTNVATSAPLGGGPITSTGTLTCATCVTSAAALTNHALVLGQGLQASAALGSLGTTTTLLHGNASGDPSFGAVSLTADVTGALPNANLANPSTTVNGVTCTLGSSCTVGIANITVAMPTGTIAGNTCTTPATATMTGLATTSTFTTAFATNPNAVTGWGASGGLLLTAWPTANTLNWSVCNPTAGSITPGAITLNVGAR